MSLKSMGPEKRRASIHFLSFNPFFAVLFAFLGGVCVNLFIHFNPECREFGKCTRTLYLDHGDTDIVEEQGYCLSGSSATWAGYSTVQSIYPPTFW